MIKIAHSADFHFDQENQVPALQSLNTFADTGIEQGVDLFVIAGDLFNRVVRNTETSGLPKLQRVIQRMMNHAPVVAVTGTPTHDIPGAYDFLVETHAEHGFTLLEPGKAYYLHNSDVWPREMVDAGQTPELIILGCPEPSKEWFLAGKNGLSRDQATEAVIQGMRQLFLGYAAMRKEYPDVPCLFVYHGEVSGASMCNGQTLPSGGIAIGRDDLAMIGANYYALGHIHLAQQIGDLPAYYSGSAFPVTWGETDTKRFNLVKIDDNGADLITVDYPHPPRKKIVLDVGANLTASKIEGFQVWVVERTRKGANFSPKSTIEFVERHALPGSRVTTEIIPTETVRAQIIQDAKTLWDKVKIYSESAGEAIRKIDVSLREKVEEREAEAVNEGLSGDGAHIRIDSLSLRGAIGIKKGTGNDEIYLDFGGYDAGLIALLGSNGEGKTTLIENMHPYTIMHTRGGKLQDHFFLRDSWRDLNFTDCRTGSTYRALIHIDGQNASGACEYHLYKDGVPLVNGRKADYEEKINALFGSLALYLRSAFVAQKASKQAPDLASATQGEKKALFRELAGLEYLQAHSEAAREKAKLIESATERDKGRYEQIKVSLAQGPALEADRTALISEQRTIAGKLADMESAGQVKKDEATKLQELVTANRRIESRIAELRRQIDDLALVTDGLDDEKIIYEAAIEKQESAAYELQEYDKLRARKEALEREQAAEYKRRDQARAQYGAQYKIVKDIEQELRSSIEKIRAEISQKRQEKAQKCAKIDHIDTVLQQPIDTTCPTCGQELPPDTATKLKAERAAQQKTLNDLQAVVFDLDQDLVAFEKADGKIMEEIAALEWPEEPRFDAVDDFELSGINVELEHFAIDEIRSTLDKAKVAAAKIETIDARIQSNDMAVEGMRSEMRELEQQYDNGADDRYQEITRELDILRERYQALREQKTRVEVELKGIEKQLEQIAEIAREGEELEKLIEQKIADAEEWRYLETAFGPNGIQALELDALAPSIAEVANKLLSSAYDARFQIEFRTTRIAGKGSKTKQVEDFEIVIHDSNDGSEQPFDTLSGGEAVWIRKAIYDAFGIIRARNTGTQFLTVFLDEADGALDPEAKVNYFRLLEAAHNESGRHHTIVITHSPDIQEMIPQRIVMTELVARETEVLA